MASTTTLLSHPSLSHSKSSFTFKTRQNPSLSCFKTLSFPSKLSYGGKKENGFVAKCAMVVKDSTYSSSVGSNSREMKNPIIVIDNYDSFTYNLCQEKSKRNSYIPRTSCIAGKIIRSPYAVMHGKSSLVYYDEKGDDGLFSGLSNPFTAGRYHSLVIEKDSFPSEELEITAWTEDGLIMAARHKKYNHLQGLQFHQESIITSEGKTTVGNFIKLVEREEAASRN